MRITCGECRYFHCYVVEPDPLGLEPFEHLRQRDGECRRLPPRFAPDADERGNVFRGVWPQVDRSEWCGEAQASAEVDPPSASAP